MIDRGQIEQFVQMLNRAWQSAGAPGVRVTSWYRDPQYNARVGGAPNSQHTLGLALDVAHDSAGAALAREARRVGLVVLDEGDHFHIQRYAAGKTPGYLYA